MYIGFWSFRLVFLTVRLLFLFIGWQKAVIGLMIFSASFGFIASILAVCGVCTSPLPKKIYYFHSAGEIFLVCGKITVCPFNIFRRFIRAIS